MKPIIIVPANTKNISELRKAGYAVVLSDSPQNVVIVTPSSRIQGDDFIMSAMKAINNSGTNPQRDFVQELWSRMVKMETAQKPPE